MTILSGVDCGGWDWGGLERVGGEAAMIKIHCMKKHVFNKKYWKEDSVSFHKNNRYVFGKSKWNILHETSCGIGT